MKFSTLLDWLETIGILAAPYVICFFLAGCGSREQAERIQELTVENEQLRQGLDAAAGLASWLGHMGIAASMCAAAAPVLVGVGLFLFLFGRPKLATTAWTAAAGCAVVPFAAYAMTWVSAQMQWLVPMSAGLLLLLVALIVWRKRFDIERRLGIDITFDGRVGAPPDDGQTDLPQAALDGSEHALEAIDPRAHGWTTSRTAQTK